MRFWMAYKLLQGNVQRALFPTMAVIVGVMSLIMTISLGDGAKNIIDKDLSAIGSNKILLGGAPLNNRDLEFIESLPFVEYGIFPERRILVGDILYRGYSKKALKVMNLSSLKIGEVVLDKNQFLDAKIGEKIDLETNLGKSRFIIKDLYQEESPFETAKVGDRVIVSDETFEKIFGRNSYNSLVVSFPRDEDGMEYIPTVLRELNRFRFGHNQIRVLETPAVYRKVEKIRSFVNKGLFVLTFISLMVGGAGILNLIAASVRDRGSYIGILKAMGMDKKSLTAIFLIEGAIVITVGATIGLIVGIVVSWIVGTILLNIPPYYNYLKILGAFILTVWIGLIFGVFPAKKAGDIEIVEALKI